MVTWGEVQRWDASELALVAHRVRTTADALHAESDSLERLIDVLDWTGQAADAARADMLDTLNRYRGAADELARVGRCLTDLTVAMYPLLQSVRDCDDRADEMTVAIDDNGGVHDGLSTYAAAGTDMWAITRDRRRGVRELEARAVESIRRAEYLDSDTAAQLSRSAAEDVPIRATATPPAGGSPAANAAFWDALPQVGRTELLVLRPGLIGDLDGIPFDVRDAANRRVLGSERLRLEQVVKDLEQRLDGNIFGGLFDDADAGLEQTRARLAALDAIAETLAHGERQLLVLDNHSAQDTLAAVAVGNVDTATHVAVFVPGLDSDVQGDLRKYDGDMDSLKSAVDQLLPTDPPETAACVTWMNYSTPHLGWNLLNPNRTVVGADAASIGAGRLATFLDGVDASRSGDPHLSLLGHSYGSLTAAHALREASATGVDELVAVGSPGLGVGTLAELSVPAGHVFVGETPNDVVADLGAFGADPSELDGVRAMSTVATAVDGRMLRSSHGHGDYFVGRTTAQHNAALIVAGKSDELVG